MYRTCLLLGLASHAVLYAQPAPAQGQPFQLSYQQVEAAYRARVGTVTVPLVLRAETGRPYSATVTTQSTQTLMDGTRVTQTTTRLEYRDAEGRTRTETSEPSKTVTIRDPVARVSYQLDPVRKSVVETSMPGRQGGGRGGSDQKSAVLEASSAKVQELMAEYKARVQDLNSNPEDLGTMPVNGIPARGTRVTTVVPAGAIGNDREFRSVVERWFSSELNMLIKSVTTDPRFGTTTYELTNISRHPPDPSLFQVPSDYRPPATALAAGVIEAIEFTGASRVPGDTLRGLILSKAGDLQSEETLRRDLSALWKSGRFSDIQLKTEQGTRGGVVIRFVLTERPQ